MGVIEDIERELNPAWYLADDEVVHERVFITAEEIEQEQSTLRNSWKNYARAYSNRDEMGLDWSIDSSRELITASLLKTWSKVLSIQQQVSSPRIVSRFAF